MIFKKIRKSQDKLKRKTLRRYIGLDLGIAEMICRESDLQVGDVILCAFSDNYKNTYLISNSSDGVYVHCALYVGNGMIVDMVSPTIREISLYELSQDYRYLSVVRCYGINELRQAKIIEFAQSCLAKKVPYNNFGALLSPLKEYFNYKVNYENQLNNKCNQKQKNRLFCSEFILECYKHCDYIQEDSWMCESEKWTPNGLAEDCGIFEFIGYLDNKIDTPVFKLVDENDPFIAGNKSFLNDAGQKRRAQNKIEHEKLINKLKENKPK